MKPKKGTSISIMMGSSTATGSSWVFHSPQTATRTGQMWRAGAKSKHVPDQIAKEAIYNHLRYLRFLGKEAVYAEEIAKALELPVSQIERIAGELEDRGVKVES